MAVNTSTKEVRGSGIRPRLDGASLAVAAFARRYAALSSWWDGVVTGGQLGPSNERELGRRTGART